MNIQMTSARQIIPIALVMVFTLLWFVFEVVHTRPMVNVAVTVFSDDWMPRPRL